MPTDQLPDVLTEPEAARYVRLSIRTLQRYIEDGRGPPRIRIGPGRVAYWKTDLEAWLRSKTTAAKQQTA